jgi:hypothetical protein
MANQFSTLDGRNCQDLRYVVSKVIFDLPNHELYRLHLHRFVPPAITQFHGSTLMRDLNWLHQSRILMNTTKIRNITVQ